MWAPHVDECIVGYQISIKHLNGCVNVRGFGNEEKDQPDGKELMVSEEERSVLHQPHDEEEHPEGLDEGQLDPLRVRIEDWTIWSDILEIEHIIHQLLLLDRVRGYIIIVKECHYLRCSMSMDDKLLITVRIDPQIIVSIKVNKDDAISSLFRVFHELVKGVLPWFV